MSEEKKVADIDRAIKKAEKLAREHNPKTLIPFPFENIDRDAGDLIIKIGGVKDENISGVLDYKNEKGVEQFRIFVNDSKSSERMYFTLAHELGHYFLHKKELIKKGLVIDSGEMIEIFRADNVLSDTKEKEANYFAATLIMPADKVKEVWNMLNDIEKCADFFRVSKLAMSIRLSTLGLID